jgi:DNA polymerase-3 subunit alpha
VPQVHEIVDRSRRDLRRDGVPGTGHADRARTGRHPAAAAYSLIKAISKKKEKEIEKNRPKFVEGAGRAGPVQGPAEELFELILKFAGYGFNKSHSTGYAIVAYQTAYLKTYFPAQYMAAFLTFESQAQKVERLDRRTWRTAARRARSTRRPGDVIARTGVEVKPPDVNLSQADFAVAYEENEAPTAAHGHIRFGMRAIKGAGEKAIEAIIARGTARRRGSRGTRAPKRKPFTVAL